MEEGIEGFLADEIRHGDEDLKVKALELEELAGTDCPLGVCVYDPGMQRPEREMDRLQHHVGMVKEALQTIELPSAE